MSTTLFRYLWLPRTRPDEDVTGMAPARCLPASIVLMTSILLAAPVSAQSTAVRASGAQGEAVRAETERLNAWFETKFEEHLRFSPIDLMYLGRKDLHDQFDDFSEAAEDARLAWQLGSVEEMERDFDYALLTPEAQTSYDLWKFQYADAVAARTFRSSRYTFNQFQAAHSLLPTLMINMHSVDERRDMEAYVARIGSLSRAIHQLIDRAGRYADAGVRPPRFAYQGVLRQSQALITGTPFDDGDDAALWADAKSKVEGLRTREVISVETAAELLAATRTALVDEFQPAYERLNAWVESELPKAEATASGVGSRPNGAAYYDQRLASSTTTEMTADEVHALGLSEVTRLRGEMEAILGVVDFDGDLPAFFEFVRSDGQFYFPNTDEGRQAYIEAAEERLAFIGARLPEYFGVLPGADLVVRRVEPFREVDGGAQHYSPGTPDGARPGTYYAHLSDMNAMPKPLLEVIAYHEGSPGHHMQISIAQERDGLPTFRRQAGFGAYIEGWGLYAEALALEMGAYDDPYANFGRLGSEMWRALRLVVDTGLHSKAWTERQAIDYMLENSSESLERVRAEVRRYLVIPGQATSYKIGMLKFQELRMRVEAALGERFDIRSFHDIVLGGGPLPLSLLERRVEHWVAEQLP